jgi:acyl dehydratase
LSAPAIAADATVAGPYYDELEVGQRFRGAPSMTLTDGVAALHQAIAGDRLTLALDRRLAARVTGAPAGIAHPALVWDVAIGQSTVATQRVIANLFYRGLQLRKVAAIGDSLATQVEVTALRDASDGRRGLATLRITTRDQHGDLVLDFHRCALLPVRPGAEAPGHTDAVEPATAQPALGSFAAIAATWDVHRSGRALSRAGFAVDPGDVVSCAPELARLTLNIAGAHHDSRFGARGRRLVYGGHTVAVAAAQLTRALPECLYIAGWRSCEHSGPVFEGDTLTSGIDVIAVEDAGSLSVAELRVRVFAEREQRELVLDWQPIVLTA